jgi:hypothetical protein
VPDQHGAVETDGVAVPAHRREVVGELELKPLPDLLRAPVLGMLGDEGADGVGVSLLVIGRGAGRDGRRFMAEDVAPLRLMIGLLLAAVAGRGEQRQTREK